MEITSSALTAAISELAAAQQHLSDIVAAQTAALEKLTIVLASEEAAIQSFLKQSANKTKSGPVA